MFFGKKRYSQEEYEEMTEIRLKMLIDKDIAARYEYTIRKYDEMDKQEVLKVFENAVNSDVVQAYWGLCFVLYQLKDFEKSKRIAEIGFEKGIRKCARILVLIYEEEKDFESLRNWLYKGAKAGITSLKRDLADAYYSGEYEIEKNYEKAFYWFEQAAKDGDAYSTYHMGVMLAEGEGCVQNADKGLQVIVDIAPKYEYANIYLGNLYTTGGNGRVDVSKSLFQGISYYQNLINSDDWARFVCMRIAIAFEYYSEYMGLKYAPLSYEYDFADDKRRLLNRALDYCNKALTINGDNETVPFDISEVEEMKNRILKNLQEL